MWKISAYNFKAILEGGISFLPGGRWLMTRKGTGGTGSARYCYSVWLRHLVKTAKFRTGPLEGVVVELGPGDSLGIGLAALLSGASRYIAVDAVRYADMDRNLAIFAELVRLFRERAPIPANDELPKVKPELADYSFPAGLLSSEQMRRNLTPDRLAAIAAALRGEGGADPLVRYVDPASVEAIAPGSVAFIFSQAVLEHVDDLPAVYKACHNWLADDGLMSHTIDFKSHGISREWNGHWVYSDAVWRLIRGRRPYLLNRQPCSAHLTQMAAAGFEALAVERTCLPSRLQPHQLAKRFRNLTKEDLTTAGAFVVARKRRA